MKRSYPYSGPSAAGGQQGAPSGQSQPDYSAYGYGATPRASGSSTDAQQAQWHQQWQQYYAQQAAAAATAAGPGSVHTSVGTAQPYAYNAPNSYQPYAQAQPQAGPSAASFPYNSTQVHAVYAAPGPYGAPMMAGHQQPPNPAATGSGHHGYGGGPASKRARMDGFGSPAQQPSYGQPAYPGAIVPAQTRQVGWQGQQRNISGPNLAARPPAKHPIPGRPQATPMNAGVGHAGGPSNMAAPMAAVGIPPRPSGGANSRSRRGGQQQSGKFNGPQGVNALGPMSNNGRAGFGQHGRNQGARRVNSAGANGAPGGNNARGDSRQQAQQKAIANFPRGPAGLKANADAFEMAQPALLQGRISAPLDHPVPITAKRTFSDFRIKQIEIEQIDWQWVREDLQELESEEEDQLEEADQDILETATVGVNEASQSNQEAQEPVALAESAADKPEKAKKRRDSSARDTTKVRIAFTANPPPANAPTGPKALVKAVEVETQTSTTDLDVSTETIVAEAGQDIGTADKQTEAVNAELSGAEIDGKGNDSLQTWSAFSRGPPHLSSNRVTISYASSRRRIIIDSEVIKSVEINRAQGSLRISVDVTTGADLRSDDVAAEKRKGEEWVVAKGVLLEARNGDATNFTAVTRHQMQASWQQKTAASDSRAEAHADKMIEVADAQEQQGADQVDESSNVDVVGVEESNSQEPAPAKPIEEDSKQSKVEAAEQSEETPSTFDDHLSLPPLHRLLKNSDENGIKVEEEVKEMSILLWLDDSSPEVKWLRTGDLHEWLSALPGVQTSLSADPLQTWAGKIHILDPDPPPSLSETFDTWIKRSNVGTALTRRQFVQEGHLGTCQVASEILSRMICIQNTTGVNGNDRMSSPSPSLSLHARDVTGELADTLSKSSYDANHTHLSLGILAVAMMTKQYADAAGVAEEELAARLTGILMAMPVFLLFGALDSLCREVLEKERVAVAKARRANGAVHGNGSRSDAASAVRSERGVGIDAGEGGEEADEGVEGEQAVEKEDEVDTSEAQDNEGAVKMEELVVDEADHDKGAVNASEEADDQKEEAE